MCVFIHHIYAKIIPDTVTLWHANNNRELRYILELLQLLFGAFSGNYFPDSWNMETMGRQKRLRNLSGESVDYLPTC